MKFSEPSDALFCHLRSLIKNNHISTYLLFSKGLVIERIGRKPLLIFGFTAMAVFFSLLTVFLNFQVGV